MTGYNGVDIAATFTGVDTFAYSFAEVIGLFGYLESNAGNITTLTSSVVADPRTMRPSAAGPRRPPAPRNLRQPQLGDPTATGVEPTLDHLALYVNTTNGITRIDHDNADYSKRALAGGGCGGDVTNSQPRTVDWNADTHIFSGRSPELVIDANGVITKAMNVSVRTSENAEPDVRGQILSETEIFVNDITNDDPGQAFFDNRVGHGALRRQRRRSRSAAAAARGTSATRSARC